MRVDAMQRDALKRWRAAWIAAHPREHATLHVRFIDFIGRKVATNRRRSSRAIRSHRLQPRDYRFGERLRRERGVRPLRKFGGAQPVGIGAFDGALDARGAGVVVEASGATASPPRESRPSDSPRSCRRCRARSRRSARRDRSGARACLARRGSRSGACRSNR